MKSLFCKYIGKIRISMDTLIVNLALVICVTIAGYSTKTVTESTRLEAGSELMLNGHPTDESALSTVAAGKLSWVTRRDKDGAVLVIPFYAYLTREGEIVKTSTIGCQPAVTEIEMAAMQSLAKDGDRIILEPVGQNAPESKRVISVKRAKYTPQFNWWPGYIPSRKDGC